MARTCVFYVRPSIRPPLTSPADRLAFFRLLRAVNMQCFDALLKLPSPQFKLIMDSIVWGIKHTMRDIADIGLRCVPVLLLELDRCPHS